MIPGKGCCKLTYFKLSCKSGKSVTLLKLESLICWSMWSESFLNTLLCFVLFFVFVLFVCLFVVVFFFMFVFVVVLLTLSSCGDYMYCSLFFSSTLTEGQVPTTQSKTPSEDKLKS